MTCSSAVFPASRIQRQQLIPEDLQTLEALFSLNLPELSKTSSLRLSSWKMFPRSLGIIRGKLSERSFTRFQNWGIVLNGRTSRCHNSARFGVPQSRRRTYIVGHRRPERAGKIFPVECGDCESPVEIIGGPQGSRVYSAEGTAITQCAGGSGGGAKTGIYFFDMNPDFDFTENARCLLARYDSGVSNHKGVNSGIFIEGDFPGAVRFIDKNGVLRVGILRKLMPIESWRLQGFSDEQFNRAAALGLRDGQLYKMAGNAVSVPVIKAIGEKIRDVIFEG